MCFIPPTPMMPPEFDPQGGPTRLSRQTLAPPKPLPWYLRDPLGALTAAVGVVLAGMLLVKIAELLGRI